MTKNDIIGQILIIFSINIKKLDELKALFKEKAKSSSSKGGKFDIEIEFNSSSKSSKPPYLKEIKLLQ